MTSPVAGSSTTEEDSTGKKIAKWLLDHTLGPVVTAIVLIVLGPTVLASLTEAYPTCSRPSGLTRLDLTSAEITGDNAVYTVIKKDENGVEVSRTNDVDL